MLDLLLRSFTHSHHLRFHLKTTHVTLWRFVLLKNGSNAPQ
uniref:Uncharacterized protein n=1 Tax=Arundo donax TaxID=35708 RepID=A0A0A8ZE97_ARUDO